MESLSRIRPWINPFLKHVKVLPYDIQIFEGWYEQWTASRDICKAVYINQAQLTSAQKMYHLHKNTKDTAEAIVKRPLLSDDNFHLVWESLNIQYENKRVLVEN